MEIIIAIIILILFILLISNNLRRKKSKVQKTKSEINIYLKQKFDFIPEIIKYCEYEEIQDEITKLKEEYDKKEDLSTGEKLNQEFNKLIQITKDNPELKSDEQFLIIQNSLVEINNKLEKVIKLYNIEVTALNVNIDVFPSNLLAKLFKIKKEDFFEI